MTLAEWLIGSLEFQAITKKPRFECKPFLNWVRGEDCIVCGKSAPSQPSHCLKKGRLRSRASDAFAIPKCQNCHSLFESISSEDFERIQEVNVRELIIQNLQNFFRDKNLVWYFKIGLEHFEELSLEELREQIIEDLQNEIEMAFER